MKDTFALAAEAFAELVRRIPDDAWSAPGLGEWDLRSLVGHTSRSLITVDTYLDRAASTEELSSPEAYLSAIGPMLVGDPSAVLERGRQAAVALGDDPARAVQEWVDRVLPRVETAADPLIETIAGGMRLSTYLPTRTFELVVHSLDIGRATGLVPRLPERVLAEVAALAARAAVVEGYGPDLILALTGRSPLPPTFSVV
jgi:uncharacterized protein (TIGR03083 family)